MGHDKNKLLTIKDADKELSDCCGELLEIINNEYKIKETTFKLAMGVLAAAVMLIPVTLKLMVS